MKKKRRIVKRTVFEANRHPAAQHPLGHAKGTDDPNCTATSVVYCNQWECYSHLLCLSDGSETETQH